jgi:hypothetical protein
MEDGIFRYGDESYFLNKLSSYSDISYKIEEFSSFFYVTLYFELNFSGKECCVKSISFFDKKNRGEGFFRNLFCKNETKEYKYMKSLVFDYLEYMEECYNRNEKPIDKIDWVVKRFSLEGKYRFIFELRKMIIESAKKYVVINR